MARAFSMGMKTNAPAPRTIKIGYLPLVDAAPLLAARELGLFAKHGVEVQLCAQPGWATLRENFVHGEIDAAASLGPLAIAIHQGIGTIAKPVVVPLILNANGNGITLSHRLTPEMIAQPGGLAKFLDNDWPEGRPLTLASVHPCSSHQFLLLQWLKQQGVAGHSRVSLVSLPPQVVVRNLAIGNIDGFCVGEPWNSVSILAGHGWCAATSPDLSKGHPEKVLVLGHDFVESQPDLALRLTAALLEACRFCQQPANREKLVGILCREGQLAPNREAIANSLGKEFATGNRQEIRAIPDFHIYHDASVNSPDTQASSWLIGGLRQTGLLPKQSTVAGDAIFRPDLFEKAAARLS